MKMKRKSSVKCVLMFFGIVLGIVCLGSKRDNAQILRIEVAIMNFRAMDGEKFPESLDELTRSGRFTPVLLEKEDLIDPWGEPIGYEYTKSLGDGFILWSSGPDKKVGTADDTVIGFPPLIEDWKARHVQSAGGQETNAVQAATQNGRATPSPSRLWLYALIPLCLIPILGAVAAWRYFRKRRRE